MDSVFNDSIDDDKSCRFVRFIHIRVKRWVKNRDQCCFKHSIIIFQQGLCFSFKGLKKILSVEIGHFLFLEMYRRQGQAYIKNCFRNFGYEVHDIWNVTRLLPLARHDLTAPKIGLFKTILHCYPCLVYTSLYVYVYVRSIN